MTEIIYLLTNPTIPGLVKVGRTNNLEQRLRSLSNHSGVPVAFEGFYACTVEDGIEVERALHEAFGDHRVNAKREFFRINPARIQAILKLFETQDQTPTVELVDDKEELDALHREQYRRSKFRFDLVGINSGAVLSFLKDETVQAEVVDPQRILFEGAITSTSDAALKVLHRMGLNWKQVQGPAYWVYEGETLAERRMRLENSEDND